MIINAITGTPQLVFANDRVRLATVIDNGRLSYAAYVHRTKSIHQFDSADAMQDFTEQMGLVSATEPLTAEQFTERLRPFVISKWRERRVKTVSLNDDGMDHISDVMGKIREQIQKGHTLVKGTGLMAEWTWTEFDDEALFLAPHGVILGEPEHQWVEMHKRGNGWIYELLNEILHELNECLA